MEIDIDEIFNEIEMKFQKTIGDIEYLKDTVKGYIAELREYKKEIEE